MDLTEALKLKPGDKVVTRIGNVFEFKGHAYNGTDGGGSVVLYGTDQETFYRSAGEVEKYVPPTPVFEVGKKYRLRGGNVGWGRVEFVGVKFAYGEYESGNCWTAKVELRSSYDEVV